MTHSILVGEAPCLLYEISTTDGVVDQRHLGLFEERWERAKNWIAVIKPNRARPGGLDRAFLPRAVGSRYLAQSVIAGDFIEVGADYITGRGKYPARVYFRVLDVRSTTWLIREAECPDDTLTIPPLGPEVEACFRVLMAGPLEAPELPTARND